MGSNSNTRRIAVGGGKGGVGKSIIAANLAVAMARMGKRVTLVDADLGAANLHTLLGIDRAAPTLRQFLLGEYDTLDEVANPTGIKNLRLIAGMSAVPGAADLTPVQKQMLLDGINDIESEVVIIDVGAGASHTVVDLFSLGDIGIVVMCAQLTSIQNAYGFIKAVVHRALGRWAKTDLQRKLVAAAGAAPEAARLGEWVKKSFREDPGFVERVLRGLDYFGLRIVGNQLFDESEAGMLHAFARMSRDLLRTETPVLGSLCASRVVHESVNERRPFVLDDVQENGAAALVEMAEALLAEDLAPIRESKGDQTSAVDMDNIIPIDSGLPRSMFRFYVRRHHRWMVDWHAILAAPGGAVPVRVREVSLGGALVEIPSKLSVGDHGELMFDALADHPSLPCVVRHVRDTEGQAGLQFLCDGELPSQVVAAAMHEKKSPQKRRA